MSKPKNILIKAFQDLDKSDLEYVNKTLSERTDKAYENIRFRKSTTGKGYVLQRINASIKDKVFARLFELRCRTLSPIHFDEKTEEYSIHISCTNQTALKLANTFPPDKLENIIGISKDGTKILSGARERRVCCEERTCTECSDRVTG